MAKTKYDGRYNTGYWDGNGVGYNSGHTDGYNQGYTAGKNGGISIDNARASLLGSVATDTSGATQQRGYAGTVTVPASSKDRIIVSISSGDGASYVRINSLPVIWDNNERCHIIIYRLPANVTSFVLNVDVCSNGYNKAYVVVVLVE